MPQSGCAAFPTSSARPATARFVRALADTSLDIARGELLCLIGPSGCGKSTLLNVIGGLMAPSSGSVAVLGKPVRGPRPREIAFVFQESALFPWNTITDNIALGMTFQGVPKSERTPRAAKALAAVGLTDFAQHYPAQLSGGMRQRAALARALSLETPILLMDEPFGALDEQTRMVLGEDLSVLLAHSGRPSCSSPTALARRCFWPTASRFLGDGPARSNKSSRSMSRIRASRTL